MRVLLVVVCFVVFTAAQLDVEHSVKSGSCPNMSGMFGICSENCLEDDDCSGKQKCCSNGCGHDCMEPQKVKDGHCPVPSGELGTCAQQCTSDANCYGNMKCCHNGCGTQCMELPMSDAQGPCRFANMMLETAISSMGNSASDSELYVPQCEADGTFAKLQCHYNLNVCWCVNSRGVMIPDTLVDLHKASNAPTCEDTVLNENCNPLSTTCTRTCDFGLNVGADGCPVCECYFPCSGFTCSPGTKCRAMHVLCTEPSCTGLPECVPEVDPTVCADGVNVVDCLIDPCQSATCGNNLRQDIECRTNYCGGCSAEFYDTNGNKVDCSAQDLVCPRGKEDVVTVCIDRCSTSRCPDGLMCCSVGCSKECVRPVPAHMTPCQQASLMAQNLQSGNQGDSSSESTIIVPRERSIPRCTTDGNYEQVQCSESIGICWCVDENNGTKISGSEVRGNPDCSADAPRHDVYIQICDTEVVQQCSRNLCYEAVCLANPTAVCRVNPCGTCTVEFYDASNQIVDCAYNLTPCQISRQTAMNNNNRGFGSFTDSLLDSLPDHVSDFVNQLGGVCGISSIGGGGIPGIGDQGRLPNIDDIFQVLFGEGTNEMPNLDQLTNLLQSWGGVNLDDAEDFNLQHIFDGIGDLWDGLFGDRHRRRSGEEDARGDGILKSDDPLFGPYIPQCGNDNNFAWKQCRGNTGICWCVDKDGSPIDGTVAMRPNSERMLCTESGADHVEPAVCSNGNPVDLCLDVSCQRTSCPGNPEAFCVIDPCNNCQETWRTCDDLSSVVDCTAERPVSTCPKDRPQQVCGEDMCSNAICRWNRCARCTVDVCGQCQVKFLDENGDVVDCDKPVTKCELENQCRPTNMLGSFVPDCLTDGSYNPVQCHGSTGYCWCVDQAGMEIDNTRQRGNRPDCGDVSIQSVTVTFTINYDFSIVRNNEKDFKMSVINQLVDKFDILDIKMIQNFQVREGSIIVTYELVMIDGADVSLVDMAQLMESEIKSGNLKLSYKNHDLPLDLESVEFDMQRADSTKGGKSNNTTVIACVAVLLVLCAVAAVVGVLVYRRQCRPGGSSGAKYVRSLNGPEVSFSNDSYDVPGGASQI